MTEQEADDTLHGTAIICTMALVWTLLAFLAAVIFHGSMAYGYVASAASVIVILVLGYILGKGMRKIGAFD